jgi:hypothetical protein
VQADALALRSQYRALLRALFRGGVVVLNRRASLSHALGKEEAASK